MLIGSETAQTEQLPFLFPNQDRYPYYIVAPPYTRFSGGAKALHLLCHSLNRVGQSAFLLANIKLPRNAPFVNPELQTPLLSDDVVEHHFRRRRTPVVVYPETTRGNPLGAPVVVRYILNFPSLLGGDAAFGPAEICVGYSRVLADSVGAGNHVLYIPTSDPQLFRPGPPGLRRSGSCFYAVKYKSFHPGKLVPPAPDCIEITRAQSPEEMAAIFQRSELLYCYENSAVALEATLCGCPVVFMPNEHLSGMIAGEILGRDGYAWGNDPAEIARARATVGNAAENYRRGLRTFWQQLTEFIAATQAKAADVSYESRLTVTLPKVPPWRVSLAFLRAGVAEIVRREGPASLARRIARRLTKTSRS
jgi:hypothetical protein